MNVKRLGIMVDENTTKQYALSEGISKTGKELTQTEKLMARYAAIMAQTATAQGDLARTIDSPVNRLRILSAQFDQAKIAFGQAIQPLQAAVIPVLTALAKAATVAAQALAYLMGSLGGFGGTGIFANAIAKKGAVVNNELADSLNESAKAYKKAGGAAKKASKDAQVGLKAFDEINQLTEETTKTGGGGAKLDEVEVPDITPASGYADALSVISDKVKEAAESIKKFWDGLKNSALGTIVEGAFDALKWLWTDVIKPFGEWALSNPDVIGNVLAGIGTAIAVWEIGKMLTGAGAIGKIGAAIAAHPVLAIMAGVAAGYTMIFGAINSSYNSAKTADLAERFGEISLTMGELEYLAGQTRSPFVNLITDIKDDYTEMAIEVDKISSLVREAGNLTFGYALQPGGLKEGQMDEIAASAEGLVTEIMSALADRKVFSMGNIPLIFGTDSAEGKRLLEIDAASWAAIEAEAEKLHLELDALIAQGFSTGMTPELAAAIAAKQQQIGDLAVTVLDVDSAKAQVRMHNLFVDMRGATLDAESVKRFNEALNAELEKQVDDIQSGLDYELSQRLVRLNFQYESGGITASEYEALKTETMGYFDDLKELKIQEAKISIENLRYVGVVEQITKAYKKEIDDTKDMMKTINKDWAEEAAQNLFGVDYETAISVASNKSDIAAKIKAEAERLYLEAAQNIKLPEEAARATAADWLDMLQPTISEWQAIKADLIANGKEVPESLANSLKDAEMLALIAQSRDEWFNTFSEGIENWSVYDAGANIVQTLINGASGGGGLYDVGADLAQGFVNGMASKVSAVIRAGESLTSAAKKAMKNNAQIESPSKVTEELGWYFGEGFAIGMGDTGNMIADSASSLANIAAKSLTPGTVKSSSMDVGSQNIVQQAVEAVLDRLQITLNVDGETWGRASVKHINNAQRMSGKLLLEM
jgi:hypothetical protein